MATGDAAGPAPEFVTARGGAVAAADGCEYDVAVCGGTLGVFAAAALARRGFRVAVVERGEIKGRAQVLGPLKAL